MLFTTKKISKLVILVRNGNCSSLFCTASQQCIGTGGGEVVVVFSGQWNEGKRFSNDPCQVLLTITFKFGHFYQSNLEF